MTDFPRLTILINTYKRPAELESTISSLLQHLSYPISLTHWLLADDCSGDNLDRYKVMAIHAVSTPVNSGWGASANNALRQIDTEYVYHQDDDFMLARYLDLRIPVVLMEANPHIGMVRYASLACSEQYVYRQHEIDLSAWLPNDKLSGMGAENGRLIYLTIEPTSPSLYLYSQTPLVYARRKWFDYYGEFPEGIMLGEGEEKYCHHVKDKLLADENAPQIAVLPDWIPMHYRIEREHSWQYTDVDNARAASQ